jgi:16S rRNA (guanine(966)-N(2))-methyltransferase RsmD
MLRLTAGKLKGRSLYTPSADTTRPTQAKLRQALFNSLQTTIPDARVLDLFAGSGALGFEALSRGAESVVFVESSRTALKLIEKNGMHLGVKDQTQILGDSVSSVEKKLAALGPFDLILADPPYESGWELKLLNSWSWNDLLTEDGIFCLEWGIQKSQVTELPDRVPFLVKIREKNYGDSMLTTYQRCEE